MAGTSPVCPASGSISAGQVEVGRFLAAGLAGFPPGSLRRHRAAFRPSSASRDPCLVCCCPCYGPAVARHGCNVLRSHTILNRSANTLVGVRGTPPIQLALHVENELGIHRVGQVVHLLLASCIHCPPSPCGRLSRPRTTTQAPSPPRAFAGRFGHPSSEGSGNAGGFPSSTAAPRPL